MRKITIVLAAGSLVSGAALAQSSVTVWGIADMGYQYSWGNTAPNQKNSMSQLKTGGQDGTRFGLRGSEDLGNSLKVNFEMAAGFNADTGTSYNNRLMSGGSWVGLEGVGWGQVKTGYFGSFIDDNTGIDVTGRIGVSSTGLVGTGRYENFVAWYSPVWNGLQVKAGYSSNAQYGTALTNIANAQDIAPYAGNLPNVRAYTAMATYANGGLKLGAAYAGFQPAETNSSPVDTDRGYDWNIGAAYDFGPVLASGYYQGQENARNIGFANGPALNIEKLQFWALGLKFPFNAGKDSVAVGYGEARNRYYDAGIEDSRNHAVTLTYLHYLSKRTNLYALYGSVRGDDYAPTGIQAYAIGGYKNALNVGIRHLF